LNGLYLRQTPPERLGDLLAPFWDQAGVDHRAVEARGRAWLAQAIPPFVERSKTLLELARSMAFLFAPPTERDPKAAATFLGSEHRVLLEEACRVLADIPDFSAEALEQAIRRLAEARGRKLVEVAQPIRVALTGTTISPPLFPVLALMGRQVVLDRLTQVLED
jgi:glutamyl-tRNA synthetase